MTIIDLYTKYKIMPTLQLHQLRVAAVAKLIAENMGVQVDTNSLVKATLLHDMGNIIKFKLDLFPQFLEPEGLDYWENVKQEFLNKYGNDEHNATYAIAKEIGLNDNEMEVLKSIGFTKSKANLQKEYTNKIACYSDHRVTPFGVVSLEERMSEGRRRFEKNKGVSQEDKKYKEEFEAYSNAMRELEQQIFEKCQIKPEDMNDENIEKIIEELKHYTF